MADITLKLFEVPVTFLDGSEAEARAEGLVASWHCKCGENLPLVGRAYFQFGHHCHTICPNEQCGRRYRVIRDANKRTCAVEEF
jgi:hypothetical protein